MPEPWWRAILRSRKRAKTRRFEWSQVLDVILDNLAVLEQRPQEQIHEELITSALASRRSAEDLVRRWDTLTPRQQDVVALVCLGYTNRHISARLGLSTATIETYIKVIRQKLALTTKSELRALFSGWDFSEWRGES